MFRKLRVPVQESEPAEQVVTAAGDLLEAGGEAMHLLVRAACDAAAAQDLLAPAGRRGRPYECLRPERLSALSPGLCRN